MRPTPAAAHPAARLLLLYAACLAAMLVAALALAAMRNAPPAGAEADRTAVPAAGTAIKATAR